MSHGRRFVLIVAIVAASASSAFAHPGHDMPEGGILAGVMHPLLGPDHLLAMITIGLLSAQIGGQAIWAIPGCFLAAMTGGGLWGMAEHELPAVEYGIAASVVLLGAAVALNRRSSLLAPMVLAGICGVLHGHAHGAEMPSVANPAHYALGFLVATVGLDVAGVALGQLAFWSAQGVTALRLSGVAIATAGVWFVLTATGVA